jgi:hypothetical protein
MRLREYSHGRDFLRITQVLLFCRLFGPPMNHLPARAAKKKKKKKNFTSQSTRQLVPWPIKINSALRRIAH